MSEADKKSDVPIIDNIEAQADIDSEETEEVNGNQAEDLRKRALQMLMEADKADQSRMSNVISNEIKPKIDEFISRLKSGQ